jgi:hypothetical protein
MSFQTASEAMPTLYLSSTESYTFGGVYECTLLRQLFFDSGKTAALVKLQPPVDCQRLGFEEPIEYFVLANRHLGQPIFSINNFPNDVHIAIPKAEISDSKTKISENELYHVAWGELYRTAADALEHRID